jgi:hypothetical protein
MHKVSCTKEKKVYARKMQSIIFYLQCVIYIAFDATPEFNPEVFKKDNTNYAYYTGAA